ncbi:IclR family transcriptional regulator [Aestuariibacter sp. A3R04]|uniref:IclR family transcriptional regulator n=1 Tax=Aestuariibacter sp. A3R04 TaxID=2841571 RepID=UPI001C0906C1|nr:helix-turn-helix domain-containing protein [Aestuariibacter sp. A3R04]MBU3021264.1 helix-turn-helix domain-containing protein [Aestuariibacter sp. A3R04]
MEDKQKYSVPALDKCFEIMEFLANCGEPATQSEIAKGISRSTNEIFRILVNLTAQNYLIRDAESSKYRLSFKLYNLSRAISPLDVLRQQALPLMENLAVKTKLSCQLFVLYQSRTMVLVHARSPDAVSLNYAEGSCFSSVFSNPGNLLMAHSKPQVREMILANEAQCDRLSAKKRTGFLSAIATLAEQCEQWHPSQHIEGVYEAMSLVGRHEGKQIGVLMLSQLGKSRQSKGAVIPELQRTAAALTDAIGL